MDCPKVDLPCHECGKTIIDAWDVGGYSIVLGPLCMKCAKEDQEEWDWITGEGAA